VASLELFVSSKLGVERQHRLTGSLLNKVVTAEEPRPSLDKMNFWKRFLDHPRWRPIISIVRQSTLEETTMESLESVIASQKAADFI
jgi:hypothetical protein